MIKLPLLRLTLFVLVASLVLAACGGEDGDPATPTTGGNPPVETSATGQPDDQTQPTGEAPAGETPGASTEQDVPTGAPTQAPQTARLSPEQLQEIRPNELGWIPVLQYHYLGPVPDELTRTPEQFRADLQWLYDNNFYVINIREYINDEIDIPAGKRPVILTFDDSSVSQFSITRDANGQLVVDPNCAVAIMESFYQQYPDFGRGGHFSMHPDRAFAWPDAWEQMEFRQIKLEWLVANGYELGNHTLDHENLALIGLEDIKYQLAETEVRTQEFLPDYRLDIVTLPYGGYPLDGDDTVFMGFEYAGRNWEYSAVLLVGANPAYAPLSTEYDPFWIPRIQMYDESWEDWRIFIEENPDIMYVSDGNPDVVTIPNDLAWALVDTLDQSGLKGRELVRY